MYACHEPPPKFRWAGWLTRMRRKLWPEVSLVNAYSQCVKEIAFWGAVEGPIEDPAREASTFRPLLPLTESSMSPLKVTGLPHEPEFFLTCIRDNKEGSWEGLLKSQSPFFFFISIADRQRGSKTMYGSCCVCHELWKPILLVICSSAQLHAKSASMCNLLISSIHIAIPHTRIIMIRNWTCHRTLFPRHVSISCWLTGWWC